MDCRQNSNISSMWGKYKKWIKLIKWIKNHRKEGNMSFDVVTNSDTFVITVSRCESTRESWNKNMLRIKY